MKYNKFYIKHFFCSHCFFICLFKIYPYFLLVIFINITDNPSKKNLSIPFLNSTHPSHRISTSQFTESISSALNLIAAAAALTAAGAVVGAKALGTTGVCCLAELHFYGYDWVSVWQNCSFVDMIECAVWQSCTFVDMIECVVWTFWCLCGCEWVCREGKSCTFYIVLKWTRR